MQKTFGPVVIQSEVNKDAFVARCLYQGYYCIFAVGGTCTHNRDREDRAIPPDSTTPDWCEMKESALEDAMIMAVENGDL